MADRWRPGNEQDVGRTPEEPGERDLHRGGAKPLRDFGKRGRLQRREAAKRKERRIGDPVAGEIVDQGAVLAMGDIVHVLHAHDVADPPPFRNLRRRDVAEPDVARPCR